MENHSSATAPNQQKNTHSPIFWLLMIFLGLTVGLPIVFGALGALIGLAAGLLGIIIGYVAVGIGLALGGLATLMASFLILFAPDTLLALNTFFGVEIVRDGFFYFSPFFGGIVGMMAGGIMTGIGGLILYSTRFIFPSLVALFERFASFVQNLFKRRSSDSVKG
jgi:hypothetical protein